MYEIILGGLLGALVTAIGIYIGFLLSRSKEKQCAIQEDERKEICRILNARKDILVRYKNCETTTYYAHIAIHKDTNEYIMIDLD